jgi:hypothetical protein
VQPLSSAKYGPCFRNTYFKNMIGPYKRSFFPLQKIGRVLGVSNLYVHDF